MLQLVYHPIPFASTLTSRKYLIISFWYVAFAFDRGAAAAMFDAAIWSFGCESEAATSAVGNGKELVICKVPLTSMPTRAPVAVVGKVAEHALTIFMTTYTPYQSWVLQGVWEIRTSASICTEFRGTSFIRSVILTGRPADRCLYRRVDLLRLSQEFEILGGACFVDAGRRKSWTFVWAKFSVVKRACGFAPRYFDFGPSNPTQNKYLVIYTCKRTMNTLKFCFKSYLKLHSFPEIKWS